MSKLLRPNGALLLLVAFIPNIAYANEKLIFGTPPTQSPEVTLVNYQPLADYMGEMIGRKIVVEPAKTFYGYSKKMRSGHYDIILDGPHFIKYRIDKMHHVVLVKQPGDLKFVVVVNRKSNINHYNDLFNQRVCSPASPNLATLTYLDLYKSPIIQPITVSVRSFKNAIECVKASKAKAAVVPIKFWLTKIKKKNGLKVIYITKNKMPARGLSVNKKTISVAERRKLIYALTNITSKSLVKKAMSTVGGSHFVKASQSEYTRIHSVLSLVWGFHI